MSKQEQVLIINPQNELKFKGSFQDGITTYLKLTNPTNDNVFYKIKTTVPKKYCVRPNAGMLRPKAKTEIEITPQAIYFDPSEKDKHKFMVQSLIAPDKDSVIEQVWKDTNPEEIMHSKLKCVFEATQEENAQEAAGQNDAKKKNVTATHVTAPSAPIQGIRKDNAEHAESGDNKTSQQLSQLLETETKLRHENQYLRDELARLHQRQESVGRSCIQPSQPSKQDTMWYTIVAISVGMAFVGILVGKFIMK